MKVKALCGFVGTHDGVKYRAQPGDTLDMPRGADWIKAGLVEKLPRTSTRKRTTRKATPKK
jgi:hypothetical protein